MAHQKICGMKRCPEKSFGRVEDGAKRIDLCKIDLDHMLFIFNFVSPNIPPKDRPTPQVRILEIWGAEATISEDKGSYELA